MTAALETVGLHKNFGALAATRDVSLRIEPGARHALIGPNGAGKTTLINLLTGVLRPDAGRILLGGSDVTALAPHRRARRGMARTFQINQLFAELTPLETVALAVAERHGLGRSWWRPVSAHADALAEAGALLERFGLADVAHTRTVILPYGKQRLLEIAVAIAAAPRVLLLDEPAAGVPEEERHEILSIVGTLPDDVAVVLIEHDMDLVFSFARRISVLVDGALFVEGAPDDVARDPRVREVYLGEARHG
jgi:branched-chain amino acid transport system ATP-binding protein